MFTDVYVFLISSKWMCYELKYACKGGLYEKLRARIRKKGMGNVRDGDSKVASRSKKKAYRGIETNGANNIGVY